MRLLENEYFSVRFYLLYLVPSLAQFVDDAVLTYQVASTKYEEGGGLLLALVEMLEERHQRVYLRVDVLHPCVA